MDHCTNRRSLERRFFLSLHGSLWTQPTSSSSVKTFFNRVILQSSLSFWNRRAPRRAKPHQRCPCDPTGSRSQVSHYCAHLRPRLARLSELRLSTLPFRQSCVKKKTPALLALSFSHDPTGSRTLLPSLRRMCPSR